MVDILSTDIRRELKDPKHPDRKGGFDGLERGKLYPETGERKEAAGLSQAEIAEQVARIEAGKELTVPKEMLAEAVKAAQVSDTLVRSQRMDADRLEALLNDPANFKRFLEEHGARDTMDAVLGVAGQENKPENQ